MSSVVIGCKTLENELNIALDACGCGYEVIWIESGLHNVPKKLNCALQEALNSAADCSHVLLAMGFCGNSVAGLESDATMVIPRVDDCISLLLGSYRERVNLAGAAHSYFLTEGWLKGERNIWREYEYTIGKYGDELGKSIFDMIMGHYSDIVLLDTGCYDLSKASEEAMRIAAALKLNYKKIPATIEYIKRLLSGDWDAESFFIVPPRHKIEIDELSLAKIKQQA